MVEIRKTTEFTWYKPSYFVFTISFNRFQIHSLTFALHGLTRYSLRDKNCNSKDVRKSRSFLEESINFLIPRYTLLMITYFQITNERLIELADHGLAVIEVEA